jgi:high-affinity K+ transport system ATPase subunit B
MVGLLTVGVILSMSSTASAHRRESGIPLNGQSRYFAASGSATHTYVRNEPKIADYDETKVEVKNVALPPGTRLIVFLSNEPIGVIKLDKYRNGVLRLKSSYQKYAPPFDPGTNIEVRTIDGQPVVR